jgi:hypothetical protein
MSNTTKNVTGGLSVFEQAYLQANLQHLEKVRRLEQACAPRPWRWTRVVLVLIVFVACGCGACVYLLPDAQGVFPEMPWDLTLYVPSIDWTRLVERVGFKKPVEAPREEPAPVAPAPDKLFPWQIIREGVLSAVAVGVMTTIALAAVSPPAAGAGAAAAVILGAPAANLLMITNE